MQRAVLRAVAALIAALMLITVSPEPAAAQRHHTVRAGDSLARIARRRRVTVWDLALANRLRPNSMLRPGQSLTIPPRGVTYLRPGQTLSHVARAHQCTVNELMRLNRLRRGRPLRAGQRLVLPGHVPAEQMAPRDWGTPDAPGTAQLRGRSREEPVTTVRLVDEQGRVTRDALESLGRAMRRHEDDAAELPHPRLALLLAAISNHFGGREVHIVSGRRAAGGYTRESSRHTSGHAADIRVAGVPRRVLWDYCRSLSHTGCGYYPRSTFVHVDVRQRAAQWVDWSSPGRRARYGNLGGPWRRFCRNARRRGHRLCRREGRSVTRASAVAEVVVLTDAAREILPVVPEIGAPGTGDADTIDEYETAREDDEETGGVQAESTDARPRARRTLPEFLYHLPLPPRRVSVTSGPHAVGERVPGVVPEE